MPQTSPMKWMLLSITPMLILLTLMNKNIYFNKNKMNNFKSLSMNWLW